MNAMVDGLGWRPLSDEIDYTALFERIQQEVFGDEIAALDIVQSIDSAHDRVHALVHVIRVTTH